MPRPTPTTRASRRLFSGRAARVSLLATLCLLLGTSTTLGVAWAINSGRLGPFAGRSTFASIDTLLDWPVPVPPDWPPPDAALRIGTRLSTRDLYAAYPPGTLASGPRGLPSAGASHRLTLTRSGWPCLAMMQTEHLAHGRAIDRHLAIWPLYHVLWPGFAANTALYTAAWSTMLLTPPALYRLALRRSRASQGLCRHCRYDLTGSPPGPCPECGHTQSVSPRLTDG